MTAPTAKVVRVDGELVLVDPVAAVVIGALRRRERLAAQADLVRHFAARIAERGSTPADLAIVLIDVDDAVGGELAEHLMPGTDWQPFRDRGEAPIARGLVGRSGIEGVIAAFDPDAGAAVRAIAGVAVVVVAFGGVSVFDAAEVSP